LSNNTNNELLIINLATVRAERNTISPPAVSRQRKLQYLMTPSSKSYQLQKSLWTNHDFENMGWHDSKLFAISFGDNFQLLFDIDYIFKGVQTEKTFKFWVSPCTLVFENVYDLEFQMDGISGGIDIDEITRNNPQKTKNADFIKVDTEFDWTIDTQQGSIFFKSIGYKQYVRQIPEEVFRLTQ
jgi:hypothetical protein